MKTTLCGRAPICLRTLFALVSVCIVAGGGCKGRESAVEKRERISAYGFDAKVGWLHGNCISIRAPELKQGTKVVIISLEKPQSSAASEIVQVAQSGDECYALLQERKDVNAAEGSFFYTIKPPEGKPLELAIGVVELASEIKTSDGMLHVDVNGDGHQNYFTQCSTSEGIKFDIWSDEPFKGKPLWSAYYYLGYETDPNCPQV